MRQSQQGFWTSLERYRAFLELTGFSIEDVELLARELNGYELVELAGYFYSPNLSFGLSLPIPGLEEEAQKAIFWKDIPGILCTSGSSIEETLGTNGLCLRDALREDFRPELLTGLGVNDWRILWETLDRFGRLKRRLEHQLLEDLGSAGFGDRLYDDLWHCLASGIQCAIFYGAGFLLLGDTKKDFRPLLNLYLSGNLPIGFNTQGELVFLCDTFAAK